MAKEPAQVTDLLEQVWPAALRAARVEADALEKMMHEDGVGGKLAAWDWRYYAEKLRLARYDLDESALRPYFEVGNVRDGVFQVAKKLFGLEFVRRNDLPPWHEQQEVYEVLEADGRHLGIVYMDFFARESKRGGAWMGELRQQSVRDGEFIHPIVTNNFNFPPPTEGSPSLLSLTEAETLFHEFGHALHGLLSDVTYEALAGTNTPRDFVEFPSQVFENWMKEPEVLRDFARHYETGEPLPEELIARIQATSKFDQGFSTVETLAATLLDLEWHTLDSAREEEPRSFESALLRKIGLIDEIIPRYRSTYFAHIFSGGYSAGYYSYLWSAVLDADAFEAFREAGLFDPATALRFREEILSKGGTRPGMDLYRAFRGRDPEIRPLLDRRGLLGATS